MSFMQINIDINYLLIRDVFNFDMSNNTVRYIASINVIYPTRYVREAPVLDASSSSR